MSLSEIYGKGHVPVLVDRVINALRPEKGGVYIDATFGAGGHSKALLAGGADFVYGFDRDPEAVQRVSKGMYENRLTVLCENFSSMREAILAHVYDESLSLPHLMDKQGDDIKVNGIMFDLGVSSMHLDVAERGFSFRLTGPLDMRMGNSDVTAEDVVNSLSQKDLENIFRIYGEERFAGRVARAIVYHRGKNRIVTSMQLADIIVSAIPNNIGSRKRDKRIMLHPATRCFQALRIVVNNELYHIAKGLMAAEYLLKPGGVIAVISFHSLEDRIVKHFMRSRSGKDISISRYMPVAKQPAIPSMCNVSKPVFPSDEEVIDNSRARSAVLRLAERTEASNMVDISFFPDILDSSSYLLKCKVNR